MRIGFGYDSHRFSEGRRLIIGGVEVNYEKGLLGHSDADALIHAIVDAISGPWGRETSAGISRTRIRISRAYPASSCSSAWPTWPFSGGITSTTWTRPSSWKSPGFPLHRGDAPEHRKGPRDGLLPDQREGQDERKDGICRAGRGHRGLRRRDPRKGRRGRRCLRKNTTLVSLSHYRRESGVESLQKGRGEGE